MSRTRVYVCLAGVIQVLTVTPGKEELLARLLADTRLTANRSAKQGLADMELLFALLDTYQVMNRVSSPHIFYALS